MVRCADPALNVVIEMELVRMRAQPDGIDLLVTLVAEPCFDHVLGENVAAQQKGVISFERIQRLLQRTGGGLHLLRLRRRQVIEILVNGLTRIDAILDAVKGPGCVAAADGRFRTKADSRKVSTRTDL